MVSSEEKRIMMANAIFGAAKRAAVCRIVDSSSVCDGFGSGLFRISVSFSRNEMVTLGNEMILEVPRRMEGIARVVDSKLWLPEDFFLNMSYEIVGNRRVFTWCGRLSKIPRDEFVLEKTIDAFMAGC